MTRKPENFQWIGFTKEQIALLDKLDFYGNNGWARNSQSEVVMPTLLAECADAGLPFPQARAALAMIGYSDAALQQLERWE